MMQYMHACYYMSYIPILTFAVMSDLNGFETNRFLDPHLSIARGGGMNKEHLRFIMNDVRLTDRSPLTSDVFVPIFIGRHKTDHD